jgi:hypothetical protein
MGDAGEKSALVLLIHRREIITYAPAVEIAPAGDRALLVTLRDATPHELQERSAALRTDLRVLAAIVGHSSIYLIFAQEPDATVLRSAGCQPAGPPAASRHRGWRRRRWNALLQRFDMRREDFVEQRSRAALPDAREYRGTGHAELVKDAAGDEG